MKASTDDSTIPHIDGQSINLIEHLNALLKQQNHTEIPIVNWPNLLRNYHLGLPIFNQSAKSCCIFLKGGIHSHIGDIMLLFNGKNDISRLLSLLDNAKSVKKFDAEKVLIISPQSLSKNLRKKEMMTVSQCRNIFKEVGYIKFPFFKLDEINRYAITNKLGTIMLPYSERQIVKNYIKEKLADQYFKTVNIILYNGDKVINK